MLERGNSVNILYWDAFAGISGDMALGSLIALGADPEILIKKLQSLGLSEFQLNVRQRQVQGIGATDIEVVVLPSKEENFIHEHAHDGEHQRHEYHDEGHGHEHHDRRLSIIEQMIQNGDLTDQAKSNALHVFHTLAEAEAHIHGTTIDQVHFHEVGAVDSIVDIVGTCIALDLLDINEIIVSILPWSNGFVNCVHGILPLPAPAALELLKGFKLRDSGVTGELITPTGAALIKTLARQDAFPLMSVKGIGYGSGKNEYGIPNLLRGVMGEK